MVTEKEICDRFLSCIDELNQNISVSQIAKTIGTSRSYLSQLKKQTSPNVRASLIANFCLIYGYSPFYIILGKGDRRYQHTNERYLQLITDLLGALFEFKAVWTDETKELANRAKNSKS